jgi:Tfp pilus assembly protein PilN
MTIKVDLLPTEKRGFRLDAMVIVLFMLVCFSTVAFWGYSQTLSAQIKVETEKVAAKKKETDELKRNLPVIQEKKNRLRKLEEQIQMIKNLVHDPQRYGNLLQEIGLLLPPNVQLQNLNIDPGPQSITFGGEADESQGSLPLATISQFMKSINESRYFSDATLASANQANKGKTFTFQMTIHYDQAAAATLPPGGTDSSAPAQGQPGQAPGQTPPGEPTPAAPDQAASPTASASPAAGGSPSPAGSPAK